MTTLPAASYLGAVMASGAGSVTVGLHAGGARWAYLGTVSGLLLSDCGTADSLDTAAEAAWKSWTSTLEAMATEEGVDEEDRTIASRLLRLAALERPLPGSAPETTCSRSGQPDSSPACSACTASCSAEPADVDPAEAEAWADGSLVEVLERNAGGGEPVVIRVMSGKAEDAEEAATEAAIRRETAGAAAEEEARADRRFAAAQKAAEAERRRQVWEAERAADYSGDRLLDGPEVDMFGRAIL